MTVYLKPDQILSDHDVSSGILRIIQAQMNSGFYDSGVNPFIGTVAFISQTDDLLSNILKHGKLPHIDNLQPRPSQRFNSSYIIVSGLILAVIAMMPLVYLLRRRLQQYSDKKSINQLSSAVQIDDNEKNQTGLLADLASSGNFLHGSNLLLQVPHGSNPLPQVPHGSNLLPQVPPLKLDLNDSDSSCASLKFWNEINTIAIEIKKETLTSSNVNMPSSDHYEGNSSTLNSLLRLLDDDDVSEGKIRNYENRSLYSRQHDNDYEGQIRNYKNRSLYSRQHHVDYEGQIRNYENKPLYNRLHHDDCEEEVRAYNSHENDLAETPFYLTPEEKIEFLDSVGIDSVASSLSFN